jgi:hypothetical protein
MKLNKLFPFFSIPLIFTAQLFTLLRDYVDPPACTRVINIYWKLQVLINCDSSIFMKDADNPERLFNGESGYQDRPLSALTASLLSKLITFFGVKDERRLVIGNSGEVYSYSINIYLAFLVINTLVLLISLLLVIKLTKSCRGQNSQISSSTMTLIAVNLLLFVGLNELTKTFFWTPHTQLFNLLFPILSIYMFSIKDNCSRNKVFLLHALGVLVLSFYYPLFFLINLILLLFQGIRARVRVLILLIALIIQFSYPKILEALGGVYQNPQIDKFRQFQWPVDILEGKASPGLFTNKILDLVLSFAITPIALIAIYVLIDFYGGRDLRRFVKDNVYYLLYIIIYFLFLLGIGLGVRRLSFGLIVFFVLWKVFESVGRGKREKQVLIFGSLVVVIQLVSWFFTNGPLV